MQNQPNTNPIGRRGGRVAGCIAAAASLGVCSQPQGGEGAQTCMKRKTVDQVSGTWGGACPMDTGEDNVKTIRCCVVTSDAMPVELCVMVTQGIRCEPTVKETPSEFTTRVFQTDNINFQSEWTTHVHSLLSCGRGGSSHARNPAFGRGAEYR